MFKILWLCNVPFSTGNIKTTGGWLQPLAEALFKSGNCEIVNIAFGNVKSVQREVVNDITQYLLPNRKKSGFGQIANIRTCEEVAKIEREVNPDIVHIWGTENVWVSIHERGYIRCKKTFVDIQGILSSYTKYFYGGLSFLEILKCIHLKEVLLPNRTLFAKKERFRGRGKVEKKSLQSFEFISTQSDWVRNQMKIINPSACLLETKIMLREPFYSAIPWKYHFDGANPVIFTSASGAIPYKGIHVLLKSIQILKRQYPNIKLRIAGEMIIGKRLKDGYSIFLLKLIKKLSLEENIILLGSISADQIIKELQNCDVCVVPSFVETYCLGLAEALMLAVPCVVSYAGALPETAIPNQEALFYDSIDYMSASVHIMNLLEDSSLAERLGQNARLRRLIENDPSLVVKTQIDIYNKILQS